MVLVCSVGYFCFWFNDENDEGTMTDGGKGDAPRPLSVPFEEFDKNFETIFGKRERQTEPIPFAGMIDIEEDNPPPNA